MSRSPQLADLRTLLVQRGHEQYDGEPVSHLEHACQAATLATRAGASEELIAAALLHDIGHLASGLPGSPSKEGHDDLHESLAVKLLRPWLPNASLHPIRLHVQAKRYLAADSAYARVLSEDSRRSLALQGGAMTAPERVQFLQQPYARSALRLRHWDDAAKRVGYPCLPFAELWATVERVSAAKLQDEWPSAGLSLPVGVISAHALFQG